MEIAPTKPVTVERPKDTDELELENLVFGDALHFRSQLTSATAATELDRYFGSDDEADEAEAGNDLNGISDDAVCDDIWSTHSRSLRSLE